MVRMLLLGNQYILNKTAWIFVWFCLHSLLTSFISGLHTAVMVMPRSLALVHVHLPMGVMVESLGTAMKGGILDESRDLADIPVTLNIAIGARRAETKTWEVIRGILDTGDCCYTKISKMLGTLKPDFCLSQHSRDEYDRYYRGGADDYYRRKDEPYRDPYREPWNGRREPDGMYCQNQRNYTGNNNNNLLGEERIHSRGGLVVKCLFYP